MNKTPKERNTKQPGFIYRKPDKEFKEWYRKQYGLEAEMIIERGPELDALFEKLYLGEFTPLEPHTEKES